MPTSHLRTGILIGITLSAMIGLLLAGRIPQDPAYHLFADRREIAAIRNFWNVLSNIPFLAVGLYGLWRRRLLRSSRARGPYTALCLGTVLVGLGSGYYHYAPSNATLLWDRLAMTVVFMALFSMLIEERVLTDSRTRTLWPLLAAGIGAVAYWSWTESLGAGDLRPYALVQFLPMLLMPVILLLYPGRYLHGSRLWSALVLYGLAKGFEHQDRQVLESIQVLSGHTIKHLVASLAVYWALLAPFRVRGRGPEASRNRIDGNEGREREGMME